MSALVLRPFWGLFTPPKPACATPIVVVPERRALLPRWWSAIAQLFVAEAAIASGDTSDWRTPRVYPPRRCQYMEEAAMRREMFRL